MRDWVANLVVVAIALVLSVASSAYMYYLRAPSVIDVRPELADAGLWTAMFSGRFASWLWHNHPLAGLAINVIVFGGTALVAVVAK